MKRFLNLEERNIRNDVKIRKLQFYMLVVKIGPIVTPILF